MSNVMGEIGHSSQSIVINLPEKTPDGWVLMKDGERPGIDFYASEKGEWLSGPSPSQKAVFISQAKIDKSKLMSDASDKIETLKDRIEAGQDKTAELKLWKSYRIALDDVDVNTAPDIIWPTAPL
ncbi:tail fiber assembly protein [Yersinia enterocolitica]|uniref:tail fiber assembly protein n=3 Tax=Yersinia enterocolitica TaxID=630 RepID=UPI00036F44A5|nr:tail fiber assembly protein [Yersinia enterocolitica]